MIDSQTAIFAFGTALLLAMPGPTNALLAAAGAARGVGKAAVLLLAGLAGYALSLGLLLSLDGIAGTFRGEIGLGLRIVATLLLVATALRMWRNSGTGFANAKQAAPGAANVFLLTLFNPKALILAFALFPPMAERGMLPLAALLFAGLVVLSGFGWIVAGAAVRRLAARADILVARLSSLVIGGFACYFAATVAADLIPLTRV